MENVIHPSFLVFHLAQILQGLHGSTRANGEEKWCTTQRQNIFPAVKCNVQEVDDSLVKTQGPKNEKLWGQSCKLG